MISLYVTDSEDVEDEEILDVICVLMHDISVRLELVLRRIATHGVICVLDTLPYQGFFYHILITQNNKKHHSS